MTDIYLCRHGRTPLNAAGRLRGRLDPDLDLVGQSEAQDLADRLSELDVSRVVASPARRAVETATLIAEKFRLPVQTDERLLDRAYGSFDGKVVEDIVAEYGSLDAAPGIEPAASVAERAQAVLTDIVREAGAGDSVVVVSHDAVIRILLNALTPTAQRKEYIQPRTGSWSLLRHDENGWRLLVLSSKDSPFDVVPALFATR